MSPRYQDSHYISDKEALAIRALIERDGERLAAAALGVSKPTMVRALAGLWLQAGSRLLIKTALTPSVGEAALTHVGGPPLPKRPPHDPTDLSNV